MLAIDSILDAAAALQHLAALTKLSRLSTAYANHLSTTALARLTALTALVVADIRSRVGCRTSLLHAQHKTVFNKEYFIRLDEDVQVNI